MPLSIKELLNNENLKGVRLVAGKSGTANIVSNVNIMDNPDTIRWLKEGELLLTTGYLLKESIDMQKDIIKEMAEIKCSGLGLKVKRYFENIPVDMIDEANKYGLPLFEIPYEYSLSEVSNIVYKEILDHKTNLLV